VRYKAKISLSLLDRVEPASDAKLVCVTGMTPTRGGEGNTTTVVGLTDGLAGIGRRAVACLRQASLGPVFGIKGGAAGGGRAQVVPMEELNLHFTGDIHAIGAANNLLAAMIDASLVGRVGNLTPAAAVLVISARAVSHHGGAGEDAPTDRRARLNAIEVGMANVRRHLAIVDAFGVPAVVAINRRAGDTNEELELLTRLSVEAGACAACVNDEFARGGAGASELAEAVIRACEAPSGFHHLYRDDEPIQDKVEAVARVYGARDVFWYPQAEQKLTQFTREGLAGLPVCIAKTHLSLSADASVLNAPEGFTLPVRDIRAYTGAGWLVPLCGEITQMPGLGKTPGAAGVDIDAEGRTVGLF
jgi:formyltetrahydrofolate synthetase